MGLRWHPRGDGRSTFDGRDATGRHCGYVTNISGRWMIYLTPWAWPGGWARDGSVRGRNCGDGWRWRVRGRSSEGADHRSD